MLTRDLLLELARSQSSVGATVATTPAVEVSVMPEIPGLTNDLLPNALYGWTKAMKVFLQKNNYDHNVFVMVAYKKSLKPLLARVEESITSLGLNPVVAKDHRLTDDLYNPLACLLCCRYGIAIFDRGDPAQLHNANIVYELAMMQTLKRDCMILKHRGLTKMPSDFLHKLYEPYSTTEDAISAIERWWERITRLS